MAQEKSGEKMVRKEVMDIADEVIKKHKNLLKKLAEEHKYLKK